MILFNKTHHIIFNLDNLIDIYVSEDVLHRPVIAGCGVDNSRYTLLICKTENQANEILTTIYEAISTGVKTIVLDDKTTSDEADSKGICI